jgi:hypothetical protein
MRLKDYDPSEEDAERIRALRGGCTCWQHPPCSACTNPITLDEAVELELPVDEVRWFNEGLSEDQFPTDADDLMKSIRNICR